VENRVTKYRQQVEAFYAATIDARSLSERDIDFRHLHQWSDAELAVLKKRKQASVVFDYIGEQVDYLLGVERDNRADPKVYPRTMKHSEAADAATDALRYACDNADFPQTSSECFEDLICPGTEAAIVEVEEVRGGYEIAVRHIPWDRFYYDPHSRRRDFKDAAYMGIVVWLDMEDAVKMYGAKARGADGKFSSLMGESEDKPENWVDEKRKRVKVCQHYYLERGEWYVCHFSGDIALRDPKPVGFKDEDGDPVCPIEAQSAFIDRENNRYGYVRRLIDPQNEINHRRSKALFLLSSRQVLLEKGAVDDQARLRAELKKADGIIEVNDGALTGRSLQINQTVDMAQGQMSMYADAVDKIKGHGANAAMQGDAEGMSGRAIQRLQKGGQIQIGPIMDSHRYWKKRIYRQIWLRIRQFWDAPMWIRVTDDEKNLRWVGLNQPITVGMELMEAAKAGDQEASALLQEALATNDPRLSEPIQGEEGIQNGLASMDVDIIIDESPDVLTSHEEQFKMLADLAKVYGPAAVPFEILLELSSIPRKKEILDRLRGGKDDGGAGKLIAMQAQLQQVLAEQQMAESQSKTAKNMAEAQKALAAAQQIEVETQMIMALPDPQPNINI